MVPNTDTTRTQNNVERWLVHEGLKFKYQKDNDVNFKVVISGPAGVRDIDTEVFEPVKQPGVIVIGRRCAFGTGQNKRFLDMNTSEQQRVQGRLAEYCNSMRIVHRFFEDDGRSIVGAYIVIDSADKQNQLDFSESLQQITKMADQIKEHIRRSI